MKRYPAEFINVPVVTDSRDRTPKKKHYAPDPAKEAKKLAAELLWRTMSEHPDDADELQRPNRNNG